MSFCNPIVVVINGAYNDALKKRIRVHGVTREELNNTGHD